MLRAILKLKLDKPAGQVLCTPRPGRIWVLLDVDQALSDLEYVMVTDRPDDPSSYDTRNAQVIAKFGRLCALRLDGDAMKKHQLPEPKRRKTPDNLTTALDLAINHGDLPANIEALAYTLLTLDAMVEDGAAAQALEALLSQHSLSRINPAPDPTRLVFERLDTLSGDIGSRLVRTPLAILVGGVSAGRTPLAVVLRTAQQNLRYITDGDISDDLVHVAHQVSLLHAQATTRHQNGLATILTALVLAAIRQLGLDVAVKAFPDAFAGEAGEPFFAFGSHIHGEIRSLPSSAEPADVLRLFMTLLDRLAACAGPGESLTVFLPFERLESEWAKKPIPALWTGLKTLGYDLAKVDTPWSGRARLLIMARSVPFKSLGSPGVKRLVLAIPPLSEAEIGMRLSAVCGKSSTKEAVQAIRTATGGVPVLTAALLHALPDYGDASILDKDLIDRAVEVLVEEIRRVCAAIPPKTEAGRVLLEFVREIRPELGAGDAPYYSMLAGGQAFLDDHLGDESFERLFRAGLLWFQPTTDSVWSSLDNGSYFRMAPRAELVAELLKAVSSSTESVGQRQ